MTSNMVETALKNRKVQGEVIRLPRGRSILGPGLELASCTLELDAGADLILSEVVMTKCTVRSPRIRRLHCRAVRFDRCAFEGVFVGVKFGMGNSEVIRCDFRRAELRDCDFQGCMIVDQSFSGWPQFVLTEPRRHAKQLLRVPWPDSARLSLALQILVQMGDEVVGFAASGVDWAKRFGVKELDLRKAIRRAGKVVVNDIDAPAAKAQSSAQRTRTVPSTRRSRVTR